MTTSVIKTSETSTEKLKYLILFDNLFNFYQTVVLLLVIFAKVSTDNVIFGVHIKCGYQDKH